MAEANPNTLLVELFLSNGRVHGLTHEVRDRRRLIDVLTESSSVVRLESARVLLGSSPAGREFASLNVEKRAILAAIPHETQQQQRQRTMLTTTVGKYETRAMRATLLLPPFIAEGSMHVPQSVGNIGDKLTADAQIFARFISVTGAKLILPGGTEIETPILLVNRDLIAGISVVARDRQCAAEDGLTRRAGHQLSVVSSQFLVISCWLQESLDTGEALAPAVHLRTED